MKWYQIKDKLPPEDEDVLVCFNPENPGCCDVLSCEPHSYGEPEWWRINATYRVYRVKPNDWWAKIELPKE